jgi:Domain of unknown function (DUF4357)
MNQKQTVKIFLAEGNPTGLRILELFNWNGRGVIIPRDRMEYASTREDIDTQGVYLLLGDTENGERVLYVGESENVHDRIKSHHKNKDFWDTAICFFSKDANLNKAHVKYLEELLIKEAMDAGRVKIENGNQPRRTKLAESDEAEILLFAENIKLILSSIGYTFLKRPTDYEKEEKDIYVCTGTNAHAEGFYTSEGFVVLKDSLARKQVAKSAKERHLKRRTALIEEGTLSDYNGESLIFRKDVVFTSPSNAAQNVLGMNANGWKHWKRKSDGKTLDEVIRK